MTPLIERFANNLCRKVNRWTLLSAFLIYVLVAAFIMRPGALKVQSLSGKRVEILDLQWHYTPEQVALILKHYTPEVREAAAGFTATADFLYPFVYTFFLVVLLALLYRRHLKEHPSWCYVALMPFGVMLFDFAENVCILYILRNYPDYPQSLAFISGWFTSFKWFSLFLVLALILSGLYRRLFKKAPVR